MTIEGFFICKYVFKSESFKYLKNKYNHIFLYRNSNYCFSTNAYIIEYHGKMRKASEHYEKMPYEVRKLYILFSVKYGPECIKDSAEKYQKQSGNRNNLYCRIGSHDNRPAHYDIEYL